LAIQERKSVVVSCGSDEDSLRWVSLMVVTILKEEVASVERRRACIERGERQGVLGPQVGV
jgi:hypothetical protein